MQIDSLKEIYLKRIFEKYDFDAYLPGDNDLTRSFLIEDEKYPVVCANLKMNGKTVLKDALLITKSGMSILITGLWSDDTYSLLPELVKENWSLTDWKDDLRTVLDTHNADYTIVLTQGPEIFDKNIMDTFPDVDIVLSADKNPSKAVSFESGGRYIAHCGKECEFAGKFDISNTEAGGFSQASVNYESFIISPVYIQDPPPHPDLKPIVDEYYAEWYIAVELARKNMPSDGKVFLGNRYCRKCHQAEYESWSNSPHAKAFEAFTNNPEQRCIPCHTTGFGYPTGFWDRELSPGYIGVGCEECHIFKKIPGMQGAHPVDEITGDTCGKCHVSPHDRDFDFDSDILNVKH